MRRANTTPPDKPYDGYPLFALASGQWAKKVSGRIFYFGVWSDPCAAVSMYLKERDYIHNGQAPPTDAETIADILNGFRNH